VNQDKHKAMNTKIIRGMSFNVDKCKSMTFTQFKVMIQNTPGIFNVFCKVTDKQLRSDYEKLTGKKIKKK
jgi:hypothetical protein